VKFQDTGEIASKMYVEWSMDNRHFYIFGLAMAPLPPLLQIIESSLYKYSMARERELRFICGQDFFLVIIFKGGLQYMVI
jgi:hypothetical protein